MVHHYDIILGAYFIKQNNLMEWQQPAKIEDTFVPA
jgi:hypothetical protein